MNVLLLRGPDIGRIHTVDWTPYGLPADVCAVIGIADAIKTNHGHKRRRVPLGRSIMGDSAPVSGHVVRQSHSEGAAVSRGACDGEYAVVGFDDCFGDAETQTGPGNGRFHGH